MDFFDRQEQARKQTRRLLWLFGLAVLAALAVNNLLIGSLVYVFNPTETASVWPWWSPARMIEASFYLAGEALVYPAHFLKLVLRPVVVAWISLGTLLSIAAGCYYKIRQLAEGGAVVAELLGGRRIEPGTSDPEEQRLRHVVEEMAVASGTAVPEIYVLDNERGINTFAAGHTRDDVALGVTRGGVKLLTRDELQGVIAHEFSHILNGDTRLNMRLIGLAHGFFWPTILGRVLIYGSTEASAASDSVLDEENQIKVLPTAPLGCLLVVLGSFSLPLVRLLKSAICRQREWLADSATVQFTRNPDGLAGALKKIGGLFKQGRLDTPHAEMASHLYFVNYNYDSWFGFLATHPPLTKRITAIDPRFNGRFPQVKMLRPNQFERDEAFEQTAASTISLQRTLPENMQGMAWEATAAHLRQASLMRLGLPVEVKLALRTPAGAAGIVCALLLSEDEAVRDRQLAVLQTRLASEDLSQTLTLIPLITGLGNRYKLALAEFAMPALRQHNRNKHDALQATLRQLVECDEAIELFEYALMKMVARQLHANFNHPAPPPTIYGRVVDVLPECALLLSALAHVGAETETDARQYFAQGAAFIDARNQPLDFRTRAEWNLSQVDAALTRLAGCSETVRRNILLACSKTVAANQQVTEREAELLRAIADSLDCPMPPFVEALRGEELAKEE